MEIGEPVVLTRLACSSGQRHRPLCVQVQNIRAGVKRKRQEICSAVEGNSISIHEVQNGRLLSSYLFAPGTTFLCPPVSIHNKTDDGTVTRKTYNVNERLGSTQIDCVTEVISNGKSDIQRANTKLNSSFGKVGRLDYLCQAISDEVIALGDTGQFAVYNVDLTSQLAAGELSLPERGGKILAYHTLSVSDAATTILKARPDIISTADSRTTVIAALYQSIGTQDNHQGNMSHLIWLFSTSKSVAQQNAYQPAACHQVNVTPSPHVRENDHLNCFTKDTKLCYASSTRFITLDFSTVTPRVISDLPAALPDVQSSIQITDYLMLFSTPNSLCLYNTQFRSFQTSRDLTQGALKRLRGGEPAGPLRFITYLPRLNRVIAIRRDSIISIDVHAGRGTEATNGLKSSSLLISNIGKGISPRDRKAKINNKIIKSAIGIIRRPGTYGDNWNSTVKQLNEAASNQAVTVFEETFMEHARVNAGLEKWNDEIDVPEGEVDHVLSSIFACPETDETNIPDKINLEIQLQAYQLIRWTAKRGYLTGSRIARSVFSRAQETDSSTTKGSIVRALARGDTSLSLLSYFLKNAPYIEPANIAVAVAILARAVRTQSGSSSPLRIESVQNESNTTDTKPHDTSATDILVSEILSTALERLAAIESRLLATVLQRHLEQQDLVALVQFLRQELYKSGWTRSVQSQAHQAPARSLIESNGQLDSAPSQDSNLSLDAILAVMSGCIDVIGPLGLLSTNSETQFIQTLIPELLSEIKRTVEAVDDAAHLQGLLRETIRYVDSARAKATAGGASSNASKKANPITVLYSETADGSGDVNSVAVLPLGSTKDMFVDRYKVRKGGGKTQERSQREVGMLLDRLRGPYALERLVV